MKGAAQAPGHGGVSHSPALEPLRHPDCPQLSHHPSTINTAWAQWNSLNIHNDRPQCLLSQQFPDDS